MEHVKNMLSQYMDRQLEQPESLRVESHLSDCGECRRELEELKAISRLVAELPKKPLPVGFMARLARRRRAQESHAAARPSFLPLPARAAAFALSTMLVMFVIYDRAKVMFPAVQEARMAAEGPAAELAGQSAAPVELPQGAMARRSEAPLAAKAAAPKRALAKAPGRPMISAMEMDAPPSGEAARSIQAAGGKRAEDNSNEALQRNLEAQKARMGIRQVAPPQPRRFEMGSLASSGGGVEVGPQSMLDIAGAGLVPSAAPIALPAPAPGGLGVPFEAPLPEEPAAAAGLVIRSDEERLEVWRRRKMPVEGPALDFSRESLAVVFSEDRRSAVAIESVDYAADRVTVTYRLLTPPQDADDSSFYQFRVLSKSDLPVFFRQAP